MSPRGPRTPIRTVRVDDELWAAALEAAARNGETVSEVVRRALVAYVRKDRRTIDGGPVAGPR